MAARQRRPRGGGGQVGRWRSAPRAAALAVPAAASRWRFGRRFGFRFGFWFGFWFGQWFRVRAVLECPVSSSGSGSGFRLGVRFRSSSGSSTGTGCKSSCGYIDKDIVCPVLGRSAFGDTWGAPRSGGRGHHGVDMMGPTGTPLVAVVSGTVTFKQNTLGGYAVWLKGNNGHAYYYAHLSAYESGGVGTVRRVQQGDIVGYRGDTGNARARRTCTSKCIRAAAGRSTRIRRRDGPAPERARRQPRCIGALLLRRACQRVMRTG